MVPRNCLRQITGNGQHGRLDQVITDIDGELNSTSARGNISVARVSLWVWAFCMGVVIASLPINSRPNFI